MDIRDNDALLERVENPLQKALFLGKSDEIVLYFFRLYSPDSLDQLVNET